MKTSRQLKQIKRAFPQQRRSLKLNLCWFVFMSFGPSTDNINKWLTGFWLNYWVSLSDATIHLDWFWKFEISKEEGGLYNIESYTCWASMSISGFCYRSRLKCLSCKTCRKFLKSCFIDFWWGLDLDLTYVRLDLKRFLKCFCYFFGLRGKYRRQYQFEGSAGFVLP